MLHEERCNINNNITIRDAHFPFAQWYGKKSLTTRSCLQCLCISLCIIMLTRINSTISKSNNVYFNFELNCSFKEARTKTNCFSRRWFHVLQQLTLWNYTMKLKMNIQYNNHLQLTLNSSLVYRGSFNKAIKKNHCTGCYSKHWKKKGGEIKVCLSPTDVWTQGHDRSCLWW